LTELIESGKVSNAAKSDEERRLLAAQEAEMGTAKELYEEVVLLREKMKSAEENYLRLEKENNEAHEVVNQLRDDVVKKQNEIIKEKKEQDILRKSVEQTETENTDLGKQISQLEKKVTDQRLSSKDTEKLCREQKTDIEKRTRENKIIQERINKLKQEYDLQVFENEKLLQTVNESK
jgi:chromosome segregation ATPase